MLNIVIAGIGGQGTILASRLIGEAAVAAGLEVRGSETIGMAQRGGSVTSHLRIGEGAIYSPLVMPGGADLVIAFEAGEAVRAVDFLKKDGLMVVCDRVIKPSAVTGIVYEKGPLLEWLSANIKTLFTVDGEKIALQCGERCLNTALLGFAMKTGAFPFSREDMEGVIRKKIKPQFVEQNIAALRAGHAGFQYESFQRGD